MSGPAPVRPQAVATTAAGPNVRDTIVARRRERIAREGHALGVPVPSERRAPLVPFLRPPGLVCEIKRRSPSRGTIDAAIDPVALAGRYRELGAPSVSVLTEEDSFGGSLADLIAVKEAHPELAVLRKDFLVDVEDIRVSHRAGADAVLLIASMLTAQELAALHREATGLGMAVLVELHEPEDFDKARPLEPTLVGINARDLSTFTVDLLTPIRLRPRIDWPHRCVFESGVGSGEQARLVGSAGFEGLLVGEAAVRDQAAVPRIADGLAAGRGAPDRFWPRVAALLDARGSDPRPERPHRLGRPQAGVRPVVKICGITTREDAELALNLGADLLGFVFADSPRRATLGLLGGLRDLPALKVAVVVTGGRRGPLDGSILEAARDGLLDAVQFHGDETPEECASYGVPYYKALRIGSADDAARIGAYAPRVLVDARDPSGYGGTGRRVPAELVDAARAAGTGLWLAGGLDPSNIRETVAAHQPELVDASSGLERSPGRKDRAKLKAFFEELSNVR